MRAEAGAFQSGAVLFACTRNAVRSPMAAAFARHYFAKRLFTDSVGVVPGEADPFMAEVMAEHGIDLARHKPKGFDAVDGGAFDLIVTFSPEAHHRAIELTRTWSVEVEYWPTHDPAHLSQIGESRAQILEGYRVLRDAIRSRVLARFSLGPMPSG